MKEIYVRNIILGLADSLVSTVGLLSGIDVSGTTRGVVILTGVVYAFVEAFSMAVGSFLSEESTEEFETKTEHFDKRPYVAGTVMFFSFLLASFIPIVPYFFLDLSLALWVSIALSILALFIVGTVIAKISEISAFKHGVKMVLLGGMAIVIGAIVGKLVKTS